MRMLIAAAVLIALPVSAKTSEPHYKAVAKAAEMCSTKGAFGRGFARSGHIDATADEAWAPFTKLTLTTTSIRAEASFRGATDSQEEDVAKAEAFRHALEKAITAKHLFAHSSKHSNGMEFHASEETGSGIAFFLRQDEEHISAECADLDR